MGLLGGWLWQGICLLWPALLGWFCGALRWFRHPRRHAVNSQREEESAWQYSSGPGLSLITLKVGIKVIVDIPQKCYTTTKTVAQRPSSTDPHVSQVMLRY